MLALLTLFHFLQGVQRQKLIFKVSLSDEILFTKKNLSGNSRMNSQKMLKII